jgi:hypothetical protein
MILRPLSGLPGNTRPCRKTHVGLNGFAEEKPCIAKRSDREYPLRGLAQTCRLDAPTRETSMTPLRLRMIEDMTLAGLAAGTQAIYLQAVRRLAAHYRRSPDQLSEDEVRAYCSPCVSAASPSAPSRPIRAAFSFSIAGRWSATGRCFGKKDSPAPAETPARRPVGRSDPRSAGPRKESDPQDVFDCHVRLRPAHQRGHDPGGHGG